METFKITEKLKSLRESRGIKPEEIAKLLKITPDAYNKLETGENEVTFKRLQEIAKIYKMPVYDILNADGKCVINQTNHKDSVGSIKNIILGNDATQNNISENEKELYERHIKQLQEENKFLKEMLAQFQKNSQI